MEAWAGWSLPKLGLAYCAGDFGRGELAIQNRRWLDSILFSILRRVERARKQEDDGHSLRALLLSASSGPCKDIWGYPRVSSQ